MAVQFRRARRQHEQGNLFLPTSFLEFRGELAPAIHLEGRDGEGHALGKHLEEARGRQRGGALMRFHNIPPGNHISCAEVFQNYAAASPNFLGVELHEVSRLLNPPVFRLANGPRTVAQLAPHEAQGFRTGRFVQQAPLFQVRENAPDHGGRDGALFFAQQHPQLVFAPARVLLAERQNTFRQIRRPGRLTHPARPMRVPFEGAEIVPIKAPLPAIKRLPADPKATAGPRRILAVEKIEQHPLQPPLCCPANLLSEARQLARFGNLIPPKCSHPDTLFECHQSFWTSTAGMPNDNHRDQPDISLFASPGFNGTGYVYCQSDYTISGAQTCDLSTASSGFLEFGIVGGTSASAPAFAGIMALVNQKQATVANPAPRQGNANYVLYALAKKSGASCTSSATEAASCIFNDVTKGNGVLPTGLPGVGTNSVPCQGGSLNCSVSTASNNGVLVDPSHPTTEAWTATANYDMTTGLGTVNANNLATNWGSVSTIPTTTTLALSPTTAITHGTGENVTVGITVKTITGTGVPAGDVSLIATFPDGTTHGFDHFTLTSGAVSGAKTQSLPGGTYTVSAHYTGDGTNAPSDSTPVQVTVGKESSQTFVVVPTFDSQGNLLNGNATSVVYGSRYILRMYVTDKNGVASTTGPPSPTCYQENLLTCPSGTVTLTDNGALVDTGGGGPGVYNLNNFGYTRDISPTLLGGVHSLVPTYSGDSSYNASSSTNSFTVKPDPISFGIDVQPPARILGVPFQVSIGAYSQYSAMAGPTGTMTFFDGTTQLGSPITVSGPAGGYEPSFFVNTTLTIATAGSHMLSAQYSGDANYASSTASTTVNVLNPTTANITFSPTTVNYGSTVTITGVIDTSVSASNATLKPTGTFTLFAGYDGQITNGVSITTMPDASGNWQVQATATITPTSSENFAITYSGDNNYAQISGFSGFLNVIIPDFSLNIPSAPFNITAGQLGSLQISVVPATNNSSPVTLSCNGNLPTGYSCSLQPSTVNLASGATSTATLTLSPSPSATAAPMPNAVTRRRVGFFFFPFGSNPLWPLSLLSAVAALLSLCLAWKSRDLRPSFGFGLLCVISLIIGCGGGSASGPPPPPPGPFATSTTVSTSSAKVAQNTTFTLSAKVTGQGNPTGTVNFYANNSWLGSSNLSAGGATLNTSIAYPGIYSVSAQYLGDSNNLSSTSAGASQAVTGSILMQVNAQTSTLFHSVNVTVTLQ